MKVFNRAFNNGTISTQVGVTRFIKLWNEDQVNENNHKRTKDYEDIANGQSKLLSPVETN
jgi:hypothetical protein